jgi:ATP-dependent Lhr-like helicase
VVLVDGTAALYLERGGRSLVTLPAADDPEIATAAVSALRGLVLPDGPLREVVLERVDHEPVAASRLAEALGAIGFRQAYRGWILRRT